MRLSYHSRKVPKHGKRSGNAICVFGQRGERRASAAYRSKRAAAAAAAATCGDSCRCPRCILPPSTPLKYPSASMTCLLTPLAAPKPLCTHSAYTAPCLLHLLCPLNATRHSLPAFALLCPLCPLTTAIRCASLISMSPRSCCMSCQAGQASAFTTVCLHLLRLELPLLSCSSYACCLHLSAFSTHSHETNSKIDFAAYTLRFAASASAFALYPLLRPLPLALLMPLALLLPLLLPLSLLLL